MYSQPLLDRCFRDREARTRHDATDMAAQLQSMGYKIHGGAAALDLDRLGIERALDAFARQLPEGATALFYYAGHGMGFERANYLIPVKHNIETEDDLPDRAVSLRRPAETTHSNAATERHATD